MTTSDHRPEPVTGLPTRSRVYNADLTNVMHAPNPTEGEHVDCLECDMPWPCNGVLVEVGQTCCDDPTPALHAGQVYCQSCDTTLIPDRASREAARQAVATRDEELDGRSVHSAWRDGMLAQGREVAPERMSWDTLSEEDRLLDDGIADRLRATRDEELRRAVEGLRRGERDYIYGRPDPEFCETWNEAVAAVLALLEEHR